MNTHFKSALNQIKADDELVNRTEQYLREALSDNNTSKISYFKKNSMRKAIIVAASFFILIFVGGGGAYAYYQAPVAYLCLDINPSVELGVNAFGTVVKAEGYNEDGQSILNGTDVTGNSVTDAVQNLILSANDKGFIADDGSTVISLTSETNNIDKASTLQNNSEAGTNAALNEIDKQAVVQKDNVALDRRDEARELGITPGKLNLINKLQAVDPDATVEDYKDTSVKDIMNAINENKENGNPASGNQKTEVNGNTENKQNNENNQNQGNTQSNGKDLNNNIVDSEEVETKSINDNKSDNATKENTDKSNAGSNNSGDTTDKKADSNSVDNDNSNTNGKSDDSNGKSGSNPTTNDNSNLEKSNNGKDTKSNNSKK